jgi:hypothetical protein
MCRTTSWVDVTVKYATKKGILPEIAGGDFKMMTMTLMTRSPMLPHMC